MEFIKPPRLREGDAVAVLATSTNLYDRFPHVYEAGLTTLRSFGLNVIELPTAHMSAADLYNSPEARAEDLNRAFADPSVKMIVNVTGGDESVRILPHIDVETVRQNPKILMGYSDNSTVAMFFARHGISAFNGPTVFAGLAQLSNARPSLEEHIRAMLFDAEAVEYLPFESWSNGYPDWAEPENANRLGELHVNTGWNWLQKGNAVTGTLIGGCMEALEFLKGTDYWPAPKHFDNAIFFLETSEEKPSITSITRWLRNYGTQGLLDRIGALLVGRARDYSPNEKLELDEAIQRLVAGEFGLTQLNVVTNMDFGHTDPQWVLPLGRLATVDPASGRFYLAESAVS